MLVPSTVIDEAPPAPTLILTIPLSLGFLRTLDHASSAMAAASFENVKAVFTCTCVESFKILAAATAAIPVAFVTSAFAVAAAAAPVLAAAAAAKVTPRT